MPYHNNGPLLVTGAAGHLGRRVVEHLLTTHGVPAAQIIAGTRKPDSLADLAAKGVIVRKVDFDDPAGLLQAFAGAHRLLIISTDKIDVPGARLRQHLNAVDAAAKAGVKHVCYTSMYACEPGSPVVALAPDHYATEQALAKSGLGWTVLRHTWYMDGLLGSLPQALKSGQLVSAGNDQGVNYVTREDCARADAAALATDSNANVRYDITGSSTVTASQLAAFASEFGGKPVKAVLVSAEQQQAGLAAAGLPPPIAALVTSIDVNTRNGTVRHVSDAVQKLTGEPAQSVRDFLAANRAALRAG
jgi:NAD(P)H dehydrogenase (quinone)